MELSTKQAEQLTRFIFENRDRMGSAGIALEEVRGPGWVSLHVALRLHPNVRTQIRRDADMAKT